MLNTRTTIKTLGQKRKWGRMVPPRMQEQYARRVGKKDSRGIDVGREWVWDAEMVEVVLAGLRGEVRGLLEDDRVWSGGQGIAPLEAGAGSRCAAILTRAGLQSGDRVEGESEVPEGVPVYALDDMLHTEIFEVLSAKLQFDKHSTWAVYSDPYRGRTVPLLLALHRLAMYLELDVADRIANGKTP